MQHDDTLWFEKFRASQSHTSLAERPIAYFCAEYALSDELPIYAGGLGILAGDYIREAARQSVPIAAVGLYYSEGFTRKELSPEGRVVDFHVSRSPEEAGLVPVLDNLGKPIFVKIPIQEQSVAVRAWRWTPKTDTGDDSTVSVYLLDSHVPENTETNQHITDALYATDKEVRLKQEMILGIGGLRLLESLHIHPSIYHLNEGHSAFLIYELIHHEMEEHNLTFIEAKERAREHILFTNHTLVAAGNDVFADDLVSFTLEKYAEEINVPAKQLVDIGLVQQSSTFSMTMLALRAAGKINAVSKLHATKAKEIWKDHPMFPITNGIYLPQWDQVKDAQHMWEKHIEQKRKLLATIFSQTGTQWDEREIVLGWARRIVRYKRPLAMVERLKRFGEMAQNANRPIRLVFAGQSHPSDGEGEEILEELQYRLRSDLKGVAVYLPHYNMDLSKQLTSGCDVWVNTPVVGFEACGTSGMKAALNGVLPLTTRDGWVDEVELFGVGWLLNDANVTDDILDILERDILPTYYAKNDQGVPEQWVAMMQNARALIWNEFSMTRALRQYLEEGMGIDVGESFDKLRT